MRDSVWKLRFEVRFAYILVLVMTAHFCQASGVTVITHGFESSIGLPGWVSEMANEIRSVPSFPGTIFSDYRITITYSNGFYFVAHSRVNGDPATSTDSGEIVVELDWSQISGDVSDSYASTADVASAVVFALTQTNLIAELNGHALAEEPIHLIGHSRGGSLMSEVCHQLGTNSIWVDHLTTLDPYPLNNDGNTDFPATVVDAPVRAYVNVLFADNYWQNLGLGYALGDPDGESVMGAYNRELTSLSGGYWNVSSFEAPDHSNVHLWYHGTINTSTPASDGSASITSSERQSWWVPYEQAGTNAGFEYSLIGRGNRLSSDQPLGPGFPAINSGLNQEWDFGAGTSNNRTALEANSGQWPNLIKLNLTGSNVVTAGDSSVATFYYQYAGQASNVTCQLYLDADFNPFNSNEMLNGTFVLTNTGSASVLIVKVGVSTSSTPPGNYAIYARISDGDRSRYLYAPEPLSIRPGLPPSLGLAFLGPRLVEINVSGTPGRSIVLQTSIDLQTWSPLITNLLATSNWTFTNNPAANDDVRFYRAVSVP